MNHLRQLGPWAAGLGFFLLATVPLHAGVVYEIEVKDYEESPPVTESVQAAVEGRYLKLGVASPGQPEEVDSIFNSELREMVLVDHKEKSYMVMNEASMRQLAGQVNSAMSEMQSQMEQMLKDVPAGQRAEIEAMMKRQMPAVQQPAARPRDELKKTGERASKSGYPCVKYEVWNGGRKIREVWVTDWSNIEGGEEAASVFEDMAGFFREMIEAMPGTGQGGSDSDGNIFDIMDKVDGFPVVSAEYGDDGSKLVENTLLSARRQTIDPDAFEPPSGYKRQEMFGP